MNKGLLSAGDACGPTLGTQPARIAIITYVYREKPAGSQFF